MFFFGMWKMWKRKQHNRLPVTHEVYPPIARQMFSSQPSIQVGPSWAINLLKVRQQISTNNMAMRSFNWNDKNHQKCEKILGTPSFSHLFHLVWLDYVGLSFTMAMSISAVGRFRAVAVDPKMWTCTWQGKQKNGTRKTGKIRNVHWFMNVP